MPAKGGRYHHGDLRPALVDAAIAVIAERGVRDFSMAEASRRLGVTTAAPYRHFADRDELLAAVAARGLTVFAAMLSGAADGADTPAQRLAAMAGAYVRFAAQQRPLFDALFSSGLDKSRHPDLQRAWEPVDALLTTVRRDRGERARLRDAAQRRRIRAGPRRRQRNRRPGDRLRPRAHHRPPGTADRGLAMGPRPGNSRAALL
jgi:AcrR family transcriptional regulator